MLLTSVQVIVCTFAFGIIGISSVKGVFPVAYKDGLAESLLDDLQDEEKKEVMSEFLKRLKDARGEDDISLSDPTDIDRAENGEQYERANKGYDIEVTGETEHDDSMLDSESFSVRTALQRDNDDGTVDVHSRAFWQLSSMISTRTGQSGTKYLNYGCWCGPGGKGKPVDNLDRCCQTHDQCYVDDLKKKGCPTNYYFQIYKWRRSGSKVTCSFDSDKCKYRQCVCDKEIADCLAKYKSQYKSSYTGWWWLLKKHWAC